MLGVLESDNPTPTIEKPGRYIHLRRNEIYHYCLDEQVTLPVL